jgi:hypothetical protein
MTNESLAAFGSDRYGIVTIVMDALGIAAKQMSNRVLTPEEDAIGDPDEPEDGVDDTLPADLWF